ncbi:hypothetical protein TNCV_737531 [Trichonephila clavipes]|nr:hypothetical protein TNCV_737531 [Trichonephila clavipes]
MHSPRSLFGIVVFEGGELKHPVEKASDKLAVRFTVGFVVNNFVQKLHHRSKGRDVFNMFAIAAISSRQTIVNKYLKNNKEVNWNGLTVVDFAVVACVAGTIAEAWWSTSLDSSYFLGVFNYFNLV